MRLDPQNIIDEINENLYDYESLKSKSIIILQNAEEIYDINFIVPVKGRSRFLQPLYDSFLDSANESDLRICFTVCEFSNIPEHSKVCKNNKLNYIWIPCSQEDQFNKSLAMNFAALYSNKSKYFLFHDLDCLIQKDFFSSLVENVKLKNCKAIQCFSDRRVLNCDKNLTDKVIKKEININKLNIDSKGVFLPKKIGSRNVAFGAPGGSILVDRNLFFNVGGYDPEIFQGNAPEDSFFWQKIDILDKMFVCNNPRIELLHMAHEPTFNKNPKKQHMESANSYFRKLNLDDKKDIITLKKKILNSYIEK